MPDHDVAPVGQPRKLTVTVTVDGVLTDPTTGRNFKVRKPDGTIVDLGAGTGVGGSSGQAFAIYDAPDQEGDHWWSFTATTPDTWQQHMFVAEQDRVNSTGLVNPLTSFARARVWVRRQLQADLDPELGDILINGYSAAIGKYCDRQFRPVETAATKTFGYQGRGFLSLAPYDLRSLTSITIGGIGLTTETVAADEYVLEPQSKTPEDTYLYLTISRTFTAPTVGRHIVTIQGNWGIATVPGDVELACLIAVADGYRNPEGAASRNLGELDYTEVSEPGDAAGRSLPADARALLAPYRRDQF